jgi:hypothetical protein
VTVITFERTGELVAHGADIKGRPDAIEFRARANQSEIDRLAEVTVTIDRWGTRTGVATLLELDEESGSWMPVAAAMPFDAFYLLSQQEVRLVFSEYVRLQPGPRYRLFLEGAVVTKPTFGVKGVQRPAEPMRARKPWKRARRRA